MEANLPNPYLAGSMININIYIYTHNVLYKSIPHMKTGWFQNSMLPDFLHQNRGQKIIDRWAKDRSPRRSWSLAKSGTTTRAAVGDLGGREELMDRPQCFFFWKIGDDKGIYMYIDVVTIVIDYVCFVIVIIIIVAVVSSSSSSSSSPSSSSSSSF